jgi:hypothetical protein
MKGPDSAIRTKTLHSGKIKRTRLFTHDHIHCNESVSFGSFRRKIHKEKMSLYIPPGTDSVIYDPDLQPEPVDHDDAEDQAQEVQEDSFVPFGTDSVLIDPDHKLPYESFWKLPSFNWGLLSQLGKIY